MRPASNLQGVFIAGSKFILENIIEQKLHLLENLDLHSKGLTALYYAEYLAMVSNVSHIKVNFTLIYI